jgi:hypothetical protein
MNMGSTGVAGECGVFLEAAGYRQDVLDLSMQYGTPVTIRLRKESDVNRDDLGSIKKKSLTPSFSTWALPVERQPDTRKLEKAGIRELVDVLIYTPILSWMESNHISDDNIGNEFSAIDTTRSTVLLDGEEWKIADKGLSTRLGKYPVYITFGLRRT